MEAFFLVKRHCAVEDGLAADPACGDAGIIERRLRGIEDVPAHAGQEHGVEIALIAGGHGPEHVAHVEGVHVVVHEAGERYGYKDDMTVLAIRLEERK